ncbi:MAG: DUF502 domain-containing protein [candidate division Zixibacteria bacterium]|nr:DUF502 domain-containing protein [candidate division Zixibacteria bacterium]
MPTNPSVGRRIYNTLRRTFISGIVITVPVIITVVVLNFLFLQVDGILSPILQRLLGKSIPGMGLVATILLIFLVGILVRNVIGSRLFGFSELLFIRTPLVRAVYSAAKQLVEAVAMPQRKVFERAVMIEYPRRGAWVMGFAAARTRVQTTAGTTANGPSDGELIAVFVPSTPTPITGFVVFLPADEVHELEISNEDAIKLLVSGGITTPPVMHRAPRKGSPAQTAGDVQ